MGTANSFRCRAGNAYGEFSIKCSKNAIPFSLSVPLHVGLLSCIQVEPLGWVTYQRCLTSSLQIQSRFLLPRTNSAMLAREEGQDCQRRRRRVFHLPAVNLLLDNSGNQCLLASRRLEWALPKSMINQYLECRHRPIRSLHSG